MFIVSAKNHPALLWRLVLTLAAALALVACSGPQQNMGTTHTALRQPILIDSQQRQEVIMTALGLLDTQYAYGGAHPTGGFDCSGLVAYVFAMATAQTLPHNTAAIADISRPVSKTRLKAGDLVFFNTLNRPNTHMGIYLGDGQFINAPSTGGKVRIDSLQNPWFAKRFDSARTLFSKS